MRKAKKLSQEKLAEMIGVAVSSLGAVETGKSFMSFPNLEKLFDILEIEPYELFIFDKEPPKDVVYSDILRRLKKHKNNTKLLFIISEIINRFD